MIKMIIFRTKYPKYPVFILFLMESHMFYVNLWAQWDGKQTCPVVNLQCRGWFWPCCSSSPPAGCSSTRSVSTSNCTGQSDTTPGCGARNAREATGTLWSSWTLPHVQLTHTWNTAEDNPEWAPEARKIVQSVSSKKPALMQLKVETAGNTVLPATLHNGFT